MELINVFGLIIVAVIMIPNVVFAVKCKDGFQNIRIGKFAEITEQIGRFGCFGFMIVNIPGTCFGPSSDEVFTAYLITESVLAVLYCAIWIVCFKRNSIFRALALSVIPSVMFLLGGIIIRSVLLTFSAILFAPSHIYISYKNAKQCRNTPSHT